MRILRSKSSPSLLPWGSGLMFWWGPSTPNPCRKMRAISCWAAIASAWPFPNPIPCRQGGADLGGPPRGAPCDGETGRDRAAGPLPRPPPPNPSQIHIEEAGYYYDVDTFNTCEQQGKLLLTLDAWGGYPPLPLHPAGGLGVSDPLWHSLSPGIRRRTLVGFSPFSRRRAWPFHRSHKNCSAVPFCKGTAL